MSDLLGRLWYTGVDKDALTLPLPPRPLRHDRKRWKVVLISAAIWLLLAVLAFLCSLVASYDGLGIDESCDEATTTGIQRQFVIDIRTTDGLTYADARIIDLAWDIVIGQGGRVLHGWILYQSVISPGLMRLMEHSSVPYSTYVDLFFRPNTWNSLLTLTLSLNTRRGWRSIALMSWYVLAIGYVMAYSSIYNAATGYLNPSSALYIMPDGSRVARNQTEAFSLCYAINDPRVIGINATGPRIIQSPDLKTLSNYGRDTLVSSLPNVLSEPSSLTFPDMYLPAVGANGPYGNDFVDMAGYIQTQALLLWALNASSFSSVGFSTQIPQTVFGNETGNSTVDLTAASWTDNQVNPDAGIRQSLRSFTFGVNNVNATVTSSDISNDKYVHSKGTYSNPEFNTTRRMLGDIGLSSVYLGITGLNQFFVNMTTGGWVTDFVFDATAVGDHTKLPYNSTLLLSAGAMSLPAPFVDVTDGCLPLYGTSRACLCYKDQALDYALDSSKIVCESLPGYVWGFSSTILAIGIGLELVWILGCWSVWIDASRKSEIFNLHRSNVGPLRVALDLVEVAKKEFGENASTYSDEELQKALEKCDPISFQCEQEHHGTKITLVSRPASQNLRRRKTGAEISSDNEEELTEKGTAICGSIPRSAGAPHRAMSSQETLRVLDRY